MLFTILEPRARLICIIRILDKKQQLFLVFIRTVPPPKIRRVASVFPWIYVNSSLF